jgi:hypothetical protein
MSVASRIVSSFAWLYVAYLLIAGYDDWPWIIVVPMFGVEFVLYVRDFRRMLREPIAPTEAENSQN